MSRARVAMTAVVLAASAALPVLGASAAEPDAGTISLTQREVKWTGPTWVVGVNALLHRGVEPICPPREADPQSQVCDHFTLKVDIPPSYWKANPGGIQITASWPNPNNKLEVLAYDASGKFLGYGLSGGRSSMVIPSASGIYDVIVEPTLVPRPPTSYVGTARIVSLPPDQANPSLGGAAAYTATPVPVGDPDKPPVNKPAPYLGPPLELAAHPVRMQSIEPTIGVDKAGVAYINTRSKIPVEGVGTLRPTHVLKTTDRGRTWQRTDTVDANAVHNQTGDPYLYVDPDHGRVFWLDLIAGTSTAGGTYVSFSDDGGKSWNHTHAYIPGLNDHETLIAGVPPKGSGLVPLDPAFPKIVYYCANQLTNVTCSRSLDGGRTYQRVGSPLLDQSLGCIVSTMDHLSTDREGRLYIGSSGCNIPMVAMSEDGGVTWTNTVVTDKILAAYHDVPTATDTAGNVYAAFSEDANSLPYLSVSRDHGATWSTPVMVAPPDVNETGMLTLTAGSPGRVALGMVATTVDNQGDLGRPWSYRMAVTQNALDPSPLFVSDVATLPDLRTKLVNRGGCCTGMADFLDLQRAPAGGGAAWGSLAVPCTSSDCQRKRNGVNNLPDGGMTYAVEQVAGPALLGPATYLGRAQGPGPTQQVAPPQAAPVSATLATTGPPPWLPALGLLVLLAPALLVRALLGRR